MSNLDFENGDEVVVVKNFADEPELLGMRGQVFRVDGSTVGVWLEYDKYPTTFRKDEVKKVEQRSGRARSPR